MAATAVVTPAAAQAGKRSCQGQKGTVVGTEGRDRLRGTPRADVIVGLGGPDRIRRVKRDDIVCAGGGRDRVISNPAIGGTPTRGSHARDGATPPVGGGAGVGVLVLGGGADALIVRCRPDAEYPDDSSNQVDGGPGDDLIDSNCPFHDSIAGGSGDDEIRIGLGRDQALGGDGDDKLLDTYSVPGDCELNLPPLFHDSGFPDRRCVQFNTIGTFWYDFEDRWNGGTGADRIVGGEANDLIAGEEGDDRLDGGPGGDAVSGGPDTDRCDGGEGDKDTNSEEGYWPLDDCESATGFEPFVEREVPGHPRPQNCSSEADPGGFESCLQTRPQLVDLGWSPDALDVRSQAGEIVVEPAIYDAVPGSPNVCSTCPLYPELTYAWVMAKSSAGEEADAYMYCDPPMGGPPIYYYSCRDSIPIPRGALSATWRVASVELGVASGHWSLYTAEDLANPALFPDTYKTGYKTEVIGSE